MEIEESGNRILARTALAWRFGFAAALDVNDLGLLADGGTGGLPGKISVYMLNELTKCPFFYKQSIITLSRDNSGLAALSQVKG